MRSHEIIHDNILSHPWGVGSGLYHKSTHVEKTPGVLQSCVGRGQLGCNVRSHRSIKPWVVYLELSIRIPYYLCIGLVSTTSMMTYWCNSSMKYICTTTNFERPTILRWIIKCDIYNYYFISHPEAPTDLIVYVSTNVNDGSNIFSFFRKPLLFPSHDRDYVK